MSETAALAADKESAAPSFDADVTTGKSLWKHERRPIISAGLLATAGGLLIGGDGSRRAFALDTATGAVLWEQRLNASIGGYPMTYMVDGVQYLAIPTGFNILGPVLSAANAGKHRSDGSP